MKNVRKKLKLTKNEKESKNFQKNKTQIYDEKTRNY